MAKAPKYNVALDLLMLAGKEARKGHPVNASTLLMRAVNNPSFVEAQRMVEATNTYALQAATKAGKMASKRKTGKRVVKAADEDLPFEDTDEETEEVLNQDAGEDLEDASEDLEDADEDLEEEEDDEDEDVEPLEASTNSQARAFSRVLAKMRKAQPKKRIR